MLSLPVLGLIALIFLVVYFGTKYHGKNLPPGVQPLPGPKGIFYNSPQSKLITFSDIYILIQVFRSSAVSMMYQA
jgi:hypothetical protein